MRLPGASPRPPSAAMLPHLVRLHFVFAAPISRPHHSPHLAEPRLFALSSLERAVLVCDGNVIHGHQLPPTLQSAEASGTVTNVPLGDAVAHYEKDLILDALKLVRGNRAKAARLLGTTERIIQYKVRKYGIDCGRFR